MRHLVRNVRYSVVQFNSSLLTIILYASVITTQNISLFHDVLTEFDYIIVLNAHAPTEDKTDELKDTCYEELQQVFCQFKCHMKVLWGYFSAKLW
jgi:hypothetical protein